ncbi:hypothetical protein BT93_E2248 [Corymbia citriodora subsp. variegata]|nr:hypothetical protein BT93_E2248 [Corymbia citriodora subsp. variegata]
MLESTRKESQGHRKLGNLHFMRRKRKIEWVIALRNLHLDSLRQFHVVDFACEEEANCPKLDSWLRFAAAHRVEDLRVSAAQVAVLGVVHHDSVFRLDGASSLVEAKLDFVVPAGNRMCCNLLKELFEQLLGVPTITIGSRCLQILSLREMEGVPPPLLKCQNLMLQGPSSQRDLPGIGCVLRSSQCLEKLVIHPTDLPLSKFGSHEESKERFNFDEEDFLCSWEGNYECLAKHLKRVEIIGFEADSFWSNHLLALIKFILGDALVLEKLIVKAKLPTRHLQKHLQAAVLSKLLGVSQNLLSFRRASKKAEVVFDYSFDLMFL